MDDVAIAHRLSAIEQQLTRVSQHLGIDCPPFPGAMAQSGGVPPEVIELTRSGNKIGAIKALREATGIGLAEAKDIVDRIA